MLDAVVGFDPRDPYTTAYTIAGHKQSYAAGLSPDGLAGKRIGAVREAFGSDENPDCAQVNAVVRGAIEMMKSAGATIVEVNLPDLTHHIVETSLYITHSRHDINAFLASRPALAYSSLDAIVRDGKYDRRLDLVDAIMTGPAHPTDDPDYYRKLAAREAFQRAVVSLVAANELDALCFPTTQVLPPTRAELNAGKWTVLGFPTNTLIAAQTWMPSIGLPAGFTHDGLAVGMEVVVPPYHKPDLFRLGYAFERATGFRRPPASAPAL